MCAYGKEPAITQEARAASAEAADTGSASPQASRPPARPATFGEVFGLGEFRSLWIAQVLSVAGDQLTRVALTLLVFDRTRSALLAAVTFTASVVPSFLGGVMLSGLADRLPRRQVMIACDLLRAALVAVMLITGIPIAALVCLLFLVTMIGAPFMSARAALYAEILHGDRYVLGTAVTQTTMQVALVAGFAAGGTLVAFFGVQTSLAADAATFMISALITAAFVQSRPAADPSRRRRGLTVAGAADATRLAFRTPELRIPMLLAWLVAFVDIYDAVAAPLAHRLGAGAIGTGMILASGALGAAAGAVVFSRLVGPARRAHWMRPLAILACAVLTAFAFQPSLPIALIILTISGGFCCYQVAASSAFVMASPPARRGQLYGIAQAGITLAQGAAMILAGAAARTMAPTTVIAVGGALGVVTGTAITAAGKRPARARIRARS